MNITRLRDIARSWQGQPNIDQFAKTCEIVDVDALLEEIGNNFWNAESQEDVDALHELQDYAKHYRDAKRA